MLDLLRKKAQSPYIQATILIIIIVFVFWGVGTQKGGGPNAVATVNEETISYQDFQNSYDRRVTQYQQQFGGNIPEGLLKSLNLPRQVLDQLVQRLLIQQGAREAGLSVSKAEIRKTIEGMESFRADGVFNLDRYKAVLASSRMAASDFEKSIGSDILVGKIMTHLDGFSNATPQEVEERFVFNNETYLLEYVSFAAENFKDKVEVTDEALVAFYEGKKDNYKTEPQYKLSYIFFPIAGLNAAGLPDEEIIRYYRENQQNYNIPEQRQARHILLKISPADSDAVKAEKRKKLAGLLKEARKGKDFAELARKHSEDSPSAAKGGDLGLFGRGRMVKPFEDAVFAMKPGEISEIVETQFGLHLVRLEAIEPATVITPENGRERIAQDLLAAQGKDLVAKLANEAYEQAILVGSLEKFAAMNSIPLLETEYFSKAKPAQELMTLPAVIAAISTLGKGELSSLIEDGAGYSIVFVKDIKEPEVPALASVRAKVARDYVADEAGRLARQAAEALLAGLRGGADWQAELARLGVAAETAGALSRANRHDSKLPASVANAVFSLSAAGPYPETVSEDAGRFYVLRFKEKMPPIPDRLAAEQEAIKQQLMQEKQLRILGAWVAHLRENAAITTNEQFFQ